MAIVSKTQFLPEHVLCEREVGNAQQRIVYPKVIDCVCVTGYSTAGLLGTHVSPGEDEGELQETLRLLSMGGGKACTAWMMVGNFTRHLANTRVEWWKTREKIAKALRSSIGKTAVLEFRDTTAMYVEPYGLGFDIVVTHGDQSMSVGRRRSGTKYQNDPLVPVAGVVRRL